MVMIMLEEQTMRTVEDVQFADLVKLLPSLSQQQLKIVKGHVDALTSSGTPDEVSTDWLLVFIMDEFAYKGVYNNKIPMSVVRGNQFYQKHKQELVVTCQYVEALLTECRSDVHRFRMRKVIAASFVSWWLDKRSNIPISLGTIMQQVKNLPQAVEYALPGYAKSGVLAMFSNGSF